MSHLHLKTYKSHETVRERNKREQRKFDLTTSGRYNEFKFKLNGISKEQKLVEKDLERIRAGVHRPPNSAIATSQKSFNPIAARSLTERNVRKDHEKSSPKRSPRPRRKSEEVEIDTDMLVQYLQKLQDANVIDIDNIMADQPDNGKPPVNQIQALDIEMSQRSAHQPERSGSLNNKQQYLPIIDDKDIGSRGSSDSKGDLINKTPSPDQRYLKNNSPVVNMSAPISGVIPDKEQSNSPGKAKDSEHSKDVLSKKKTSNQEEYNGGNKPVYNYESYGEFGHNRTILNSDKQWEEARRARYVRTREPLERDRELSVKEIFDQTKP